MAVNHLLTISGHAFFMEAAMQTRDSFEAQQTELVIQISLLTGLLITVLGFFAAVAIR
jgi:hypothetical protein